MGGLEIEATLYEKLHETWQIDQMGVLAEVRSCRLDGEKDLPHFLDAEGKEFLRMSREARKP